MPSSDAPDFWLYGYGSLIWKPPPHFDRRVPGWVTGYVRRFWQVGDGQRRLVSDTLLTPSIGQRGSPRHPRGPRPRLAYRILPDRVAQVKDYLDIREVNGYSIHYTPFHPADGSSPISTLVYIGAPDNDQFVGPQDPDELARHILASRGPSGLNRDYLFNLETALDELSPDSGDLHVSDLSHRVRLLEHEANTTAPRPLPLDTAVSQHASTVEADELEKA
ncbi:hypothetical protein XA68_16357 [Ophiocordyceps unilateralis]|uniref:glutathione-specific gamma-glutamylcyclotransferase n=1 Tax=Ophiocordyceps unilateralis TaxID=268505 RepID=A0A2A9P4W4_OPHUN|nr:hypothetical protein XA68_16357 [Ophiocordyceps unilateralis]